MKYFINNLDSPIGNELYTLLTQLDQRDGFHIGSLNNNQQHKFQRFKLINHFFELKDIIEECDVFIYQIQYSTQAELDYMLDDLQQITQTFQKQKILIVISSLLSWEATPNKQIQHFINNQIIESKDLQQSNTYQNQKIFQETPWEESDFQQRASSEKEQDLQDWEDLFLSNQNENLKIIILSPGLIYGHKDDIFQKYFQAALLQQSLKVFGDGQNELPTIHIKDLVSMIVQVAETVPNTKYIFAVDNTEDRKLTSIVQGISLGIGNGKIDYVTNTIQKEEQNQFQDFNSYDIYCLSLNLNCNPSKIFVGTKENPSDFKWHCEKGIVSNLSKLTTEYRKLNNIKAIEIFIDSSQSDIQSETIISFISYYYQIPLITLEQIIQDIQIQNLIITAQLKKELLQNGLVIEIIQKCIQWRLNQLDCLNRGYIFLNFTFIIEQFESILLKLFSTLHDEIYSKKGPENHFSNNQELQQFKQQSKQETESKNNPNLLVQTDHFPQSFIIFKNCTNDYDLKKSIQVANQMGLKNQEDLYIIDSKILNIKLTLNNLKSYIERNGRSNIYFQNDEKQQNQTLCCYYIRNLIQKLIIKRAYQIWKEILIKQKLALKITINDLVKNIQQVQFQNISDQNYQQDLVNRSELQNVRDLALDQSDCNHEINKSNKKLEIQEYKTSLYFENE